MKIKSLFSATLLVAAAMGFTSCSDDDDNVITIPFQNESIKMDGATSAWDDVYNVSITEINYSGFTFSHSALASEWGGVTYYSWQGFCPSLSSDVQDRTEIGDWVDHQWGAITGKGVVAGRPYMLAMWDAWGEMSLQQPENPALEIAYTLGNKTFRPQSIAITNSTWGYYGMKNGSYPAQPFGDNSFCYVYINGVKDGKKVGSVRVELAKGKEILDTWATVDLTSLGEVNSIYFQMESSDSGDYGMNNPAYFCLDDFRVAID
ncbi:MAG: DUF4465 domain-containing protein [Muribaculaceae bacterium]